MSARSEQLELYRVTYADGRERTLQLSAKDADQLREAGATVGKPRKKAAG